MKNLIAVAGFLALTSIPLAAQTATPEQERAHPLEANTPENLEYKRTHSPYYRPRTSDDPQYRHATTAADEKAKARATAVQSPPPADSATEPAKTDTVPGEKKKPQR